MRHLISFLLVLLAVSPAAAAGPQTMGPLAPHVDLDPQGNPWQVTEDDGTLVIENTSQPGIVTYYYVEPNQRPLVASVRVTATGDGKDMSGAGLLYALQGEGDRRLYYVFMLQPDGTTSVLRRDSTGVNRMIATQRSDLDRSKPVELMVEETGGGAAFFVDGERMGTIQSAGIGSGSVGIAAAGRGRFTFRDFQLDAAGTR